MINAALLTCFSKMLINASIVNVNSELENILISANKVGMISYIKNHTEYFEEAINLAVSDKQPYSWRAASLLWSCMEKNDMRIQKHVKKIINILPTKKDGHQRELLIILLKIELNEDCESVLFDMCMTIWESINKQPSVRFTAFKFIDKIVKKHPELSKEVAFITQDQYLKTLSPTVRKSILKMIKIYKPNKHPSEF